MSELGKFHSSLVSHFSDLSEKRKEASCPTFALEHPLTESQVEELKRAVRHRQHVQPLMQEWMAWVVYATELGYSFEGREYWESFESVTPNWSIGDREFIRKAFGRFVEKFNGYRPQGAWAKHRSIIAYPITHSVIPRDLQREFARVLYDLRYHLSRSSTNIDELGRLIERVSINCSNRFQQLAENTRLTGLIATQMLLSGAEGNLEGFLYPPTLERIVGDVRWHRDAALWLDEARSHARTSATQSQSRTRSLPDLPMLFLQRSGLNLWDLWIEIPNLASLLDIQPEVYQFLQKTRIEIIGNAANERLAPTILSRHGPIRRKLSCLPAQGAPILQASVELPTTVKNFFDEFCPGSATFVFKVRDDGRALSVGSTIARPGEVFLFFASQTPPAEVARQVGTSLPSPRLFELTIPQTPSLNVASFLATLGLRVHSNEVIEVQGLGSVPRYSDPDAIAFFEGEVPIIALKTESDRRIRVIDGDKTLPMSMRAGQWSYFSPERGPADERTIRILSDDSGAELERVRILILPRGSQPDGNSRSLFAVVTTPFAPTLEQLCLGKAEFHLMAPDHEKIRISLSLDKDVDKPALELSLLTCQMPTSNLGSEISSKLSALDRRSSERLENSFKVAIKFTSANYGVIDVVCGRESLPVRWKVLEIEGNRVLRLENHSDENARLKVSFYDLVTPDNPKLVPEFEMGFSDITLNDQSGLFVAEGAQASSGVIILPSPNPGLVIRNLSDLAVDNGPEIRLMERRNAENDFMKLLDIACLWAVSPHSGNPLTLVRLKAVRNSLACELIRIVGGNPSWRRSEADYCRRHLTKQRLLEAVTPVQQVRRRLGQIDVGGVHTVRDLIPLLTDALGSEVARQTIPVRTQGRVRALRPIRRSWFVEFALRLATAPESLPKWADAKLVPGVKMMFDRPVIARSSRYLYLVNRDGVLDWRWLD